jgi:hypothetical protein
MDNQITGIGVENNRCASCRLGGWQRTPVLLSRVYAEVEIIVAGLELYERRLPTVELQAHFTFSIVGCRSVGSTWRYLFVIGNLRQSLCTPDAVDKVG